MKETDSKTEWTVSQVTKVVTTLAEKRHGLDFATYVAMIERGDESIDCFRDSDMIGLLKLIGVERKHQK